MRHASDYDVDEINKNLILYFGKDLDGLPKYRVVWAESRTEKRIGTFTEWYGSIIVRETANVLQETKKYAYLKGRWILEKRVFFPKSPFPDVMADMVLPGRAETNGWYECLWCFQDRNLNYLPPWWTAIEYLLKMLMYGTHERVLNWDNEQKKSENQEIEKFVDILTDAGSPFLGALAHGEAVSYAGLDAKERLK